MKRAFALATLLWCVPAAGHAVCTVTASGVAFGVYDPFSGAATNAAGAVSLDCSQFFGSYAIALGPGLNGAGGFSSRRMSARTAVLGYQLYLDAGHTQVWGDGTGGSVTVRSGACLGICRNIHPLYGRIPARQPARPGAYGDTILVTVTF